MKLRVLNNSFRLRLSQSELSKLKEGLEISNKTIISVPKDVQFSYKLIPSENSIITIAFEENTLLFSVPDQIVSKWAEGEDVSMSFTIDTGKNTSINLLIEKDFKCLTARAFEDESDLFPHPEEEKLSC